MSSGFLAGMPGGDTESDKTAGAVAVSVGASYTWGMIESNLKRELKRYAGQLEKLNKRGVPYAMRDTVNRAAFETRKRGISNLQDGMTLRNRWTVGSVRVNKARSLDPRRMEAETGSLEKYLYTQEFGGTKIKRGKEGVAIPTGYSAGQQGQKPRTRLPRGKNKLRAIQLNNKRIKAKNRRQRNFLAIKQAAEGGNKFIFMDLGRTQGLFRVTGGKRKPRVKMVYDLSRQSVKIPARPWLTPATNRTVPEMPGFYRSALRFQLKRLR